MFVLLHLIGLAVEFAGLLKGSKRSTRDVGKVRKLYGVPLSRGMAAKSSSNSGGKNHHNETRLQESSFSFCIVLGKYREIFILL